LLQILSHGWLHTGHLINEITWKDSWTFICLFICFRFAWNYGIILGYTWSRLELSNLFKFDGWVGLGFILLWGSVYWYCFGPFLLNLIFCHLAKCVELAFQIIFSWTFCSCFRQVVYVKVGIELVCTARIIECLNIRTSIFISLRGFFGLLRLFAAATTFTR